jgi:hypothetical protein
MPVRKTEKEIKTSREKKKTVEKNKDLQNCTWRGEHKYDYKTLCFKPVSFFFFLVVLHSLPFSHHTPFSFLLLLCWSVESSDTAARHSSCTKTAEIRRKEKKRATEEEKKKIIPSVCRVWKETRITGKGALEHKRRPFLSFASPKWTKLHRCRVSVVPAKHQKSITTTRCHKAREHTHIRNSNNNKKHIHTQKGEGDMEKEREKRRER